MHPLYSSKSAVSKHGPDFVTVGFLVEANFLLQKFVKRLTTETTNRPNIARHPDKVKWSL